MNCSKFNELKHEYCSETMHLTMLDQVNCFFISKNLFAHMFFLFFSKLPLENLCWNIQLLIFNLMYVTSIKNFNFFIYEMLLYFDVLGPWMIGKVLH
jgi:hypothetical protein